MNPRDGCQKKQNEGGESLIFLSLSANDISNARLADERSDMIGISGVEDCFRLIHKHDNCCKAELRSCVNFEEDEQEKSENVRGWNEGKKINVTHEKFCLPRRIREASSVRINSKCTGARRETRNFVLGLSAVAASSLVPDDGTSEFSFGKKKRSRRRD